MLVNRKFQDWDEDDDRLSCRPPFLGPNTSSVIFSLEYTRQITHIGNKEYICGDGNCGHTGSQRGLMNISGGVSQGPMAYRT